MSIEYRGYLRLAQILELLPIGKSKWWEGCKSGEYPNPVKLSVNVTGWKREEINALLYRLEGKEAQPEDHRGYIRLPRVLALIPIGESTWWEGCRTGRYPQAYKLSRNVTGWKVADIESYLLSLDDDQGGEAA